MKSFHCLFVLSLLAASAQAALAEPAILTRGPHSRVWQNEAGGTYIELATGLCYQQDGQGPWLDSQEIIELLPGGGAVARQGQHPAIFPANLNAGALELFTPDGRRFVSRTLGLAYFDAASGQSALIAELKDSVGQVVEANQVVYPDVFSDVQADVRCTWHLGSFEVDVVLRQQPPSPAQWSFNPDTTRLQVWTEFSDWPEGTKQTTFLRQETDPVKRRTMAEPDFKDELLEFGTMQMGRGKAFAIETDAIRQAGIDVGAEVPVGKEFDTFQDPDTLQPRTFLVESVEYAQVKPLLDTLPQMAAAAPAKANVGQASTPVPAADKNAQAAARQRQPVPSRAQLLAGWPQLPKEDLMRSRRQLSAKAAQAPRSAAVPSRSSTQGPRARQTSPQSLDPTAPSNPQLSTLNRRDGVVIDCVTLNTSIPVRLTTYSVPIQRITSRPRSTWPPGLIQIIWIDVTSWILDCCTPDSNGWCVLDQGRTKLGGWSNGDQKKKRKKSLRGSPNYAIVFLFFRAWFEGTSKSVLTVRLAERRSLPPVGKKVPRGRG
jgi:hypothetical protein